MILAIPHNKLPPNSNHLLNNLSTAGLTVSTGLSPSINPLKKSSSYNNKSTDNSDPPEIISDQLITTPRERANSLSECTTETLLSPSDTANNDKNRLLSKNQASVPKLTYPLQPHQGRNPCLARNLMRDLPNEPPILIQECSPKYPINKKMISFSDGDANIFSLPPGMESNLIPRDLGGMDMRGRVVHPIPYVQNEVGNVIPKETNLNRQTREFLQKSSERRWNPLNMRNIRAGFKMLLDRKSSASHGHIPEEQQPLKSSGISSPVSPSGGQTNPVDAFWKEDNFGVMCGDDLSTADGNAVMKSYDHHLLNGHAISVNPGMPVPAFPSHIERSKRPTTLLVNSMDDDDEDTENDIIIDMSDSDIPKDSSAVDPVIDGYERPPSIRRKGSGGRRKVVRRVKTPFEIKGRFSLYDDRIMSSQELPSTCVVNVSQPQLDTAKFSASVPLNMNTLCVSPASDSSQVDLKDDPKRCVKDKSANGHILPVIANGQQNLFSLCDI